MAETNHQRFWPKQYRTEKKPRLMNHDYLARSYASQSSLSLQVYPSLSTMKILILSTPHNLDLYPSQVHTHPSFLVILFPLKKKLPLIKREREKVKGQKGMASVLNTGVG